MSGYLPVIISAVLIIAILLWWLIALDGIKKTDSGSDQVAPPPAPPKAVPAPPVVLPAAPISPLAPTAPKLMDDPAPATKTAKAKVQAPLKAAATKKAPIAKPVAPKAKTPKTAAPKASAPIAPVAEMAAPVAAAKPKVVKPKVAKPTPAISIPDNLEVLKGLGPKVASMLKALGVTSIAQVAGWTEADVAEIDTKLGAFAGRIKRDNWVDQAQLLAAGDIAGFEAKYGALGGGVKG